MARTKRRRVRVRRKTGGRKHAAAALACYVPARRATRIDPLTTLRTG